MADLMSFIASEFGSMCLFCEAHLWIRSIPFRMNVYLCVAATDESFLLGLISSGSEASSRSTCDSFSGTCERKLVSEFDGSCRDVQIFLGRSLVSICPISRHFDGFCTPILSSLRTANSVLLSHVKAESEL